MARSFQDAFEAWKKDDSYEIGPDIGQEFYDQHEARPTRAERSSAPDENGTTDSAKAI